MRPVQPRDALASSCRLAQVDAARAGCRRDEEFDITNSSSTLKSGTLIRPAQEVDACACVRE